MMKEQIKNITIVSLVMILAVVSFAYVKQMRSIQPTIIKNDTIITKTIDTLWKDTTITKKEFIPKYITKIKTDTLFKENGDTVQLVTESKRFDKSIVSDKDTADIQIYTSGIKTSLDSLKMRFKTHKEVITNTVEITKYVEKKKSFKDRIKVIPNVGVGYGLINNKPDIYIGVGIGYEL